MSTLYITEHARQGRDSGGYVIQGVPEYPALAEQVVTVGAGSVQSAAFNVSTALIVLTSDVVCSVAISANPTATATNRRIPANVPVEIAVPPGSGLKLAAITNT